jgi:hypothetical protein
MVRSFGRMPNTRSFCFIASSKKQRPSILKGGVDDAVGRGGLRLETHSQIAPGAAPAAQPDMKKESAKRVPLEEIHQDCHYFHATIKNQSNRHPPE